MRGPFPDEGRLPELPSQDGCCCVLASWRAARAMESSFPGKGRRRRHWEKTSRALQRSGGKDHFNLSAAFTPRESRKGGLGHAR